MPSRILMMVKSGTDWMTVPVMMSPTRSENSS